jgi:hypothetical protein
MSSSTNRRLKTELSEKKYIEKPTINELYNSYLTMEEIKRHPEITPAIKGDKKFRLDILSNQKPKIISVKGIHNENKIKFATRLNAFHKIFFDYTKNQKNSLNEIHSLSKENKVFIQKYKNANKKDDQEKFSDIKSEYEKRNYYVPPLEGKKNLFNGNILLSNKEELQNYILYDLGSHISNSKSLSFLHKINKKLGDKSSEKALKMINVAIDPSSFNKDKIEKNRIKEIHKAQNDIMNVQETINSLDDIDYFFDIDNKQYLESLKSQDSRGSSAKISTRVNSAFNRIENVKIKPNANPLNKNTDNDNDNNNKLKKKIKYISRLKKKSKFNDDSENKSNGIGIRQYSTDKKYTKTIDNNDISKSPLERLYDRISTKENLLNYQPEIKDYLENRKYDVSIKINPSLICNNFEKTREKVCQSDTFKQDLHLRKQLDGSTTNIDKINNNDLKTKDKINNVEDKMIKLFCDINNPRKKGE